MRLGLINSIIKNHVSLWRHKYETDVPATHRFDQSGMTQNNWLSSLEIIRVKVCGQLDRNRRSRQTN